MKYLINSERPYYNYSHHKADTGEIFYVGKGKKDRAWSMSGRTKYWYNIVNKHGLIVKMIAYHQYDIDAIQMEIHLISMIGRKDKGLGPLINLTAGGDGISGIIKQPISDITREKMRIAKLGEKSVWFGKNHTQETKNLMSEIKKTKPKSKKQLLEYASRKGKTSKRKGISLSDADKRNKSIAARGKPKSDSHRKNLSLARKGFRLSEQAKINFANAKRKTTEERKKLSNYIDPQKKARKTRLLKKFDVLSKIIFTR